VATTRRTVEAMAEELAWFIERGSDARGAVGDRAITRTCPALTPVGG
jgi:hypothetical protein